MRKRLILVVIGLAILAVAGGGWLIYQQNASQAKEVTQTTNHKTTSSQLQTLDYKIDYDGKTYDKNAVVYVPDSYQDNSPMNIFYLMHGSTMNNVDFAETMQPLFDQWITSGEMSPMLVVFPTYYPDSSFVVSNYTEDYPLNHFFATDEVKTVMKTVESQLTTYAGKDTSDTSFENSRAHRAFGGYSMGGITTWDILVSQSQFFHDYMPMAGDSWIGQITGDSSDEAVADTLVSGLEENNYQTNDVKIIAMVGENDGTKYSMQPQINALLRNHSDLITEDNLIYWENANGGHNQESLELEVQHGVAYLFQ